MGNTVWLQLSDGRTKSGGERDHTFLLKFEKELEGIAQRLNVAKLTRFYDQSALAMEFADELEAIGEADELLTSEKWSDAVNGLRTFQALLRELEEHPDALPASSDPARAHWPAALMSELAGCESTLRDAVAGKRRFRLLIVP